jgi:hypothetical protein
MMPAKSEVVRFVIWMGSALVGMIVGFGIRALGWFPTWVHVTCGILVFLTVRALVQIKFPFLYEDEDSKW